MMQGNNRTLKRMPVEEMVAEPPAPVPWIVKPLLARGCLTLFAGRHGEGKSLIAQAIGISVIGGRPNPLDLAPSSGSVLVIDGENGRGEIHRRVHALGLNAELATRIDFYEADGFHLGRELAELESLIREHRPSLVVLDSFRSLWTTGDENDSGSVAAVLDPLRQLVRRENVASLLLHHTAKGGGSYRGSTAIGASVDLAFKVDRAEGDPVPTRRRITCTKSRIGPEPPPMWLSIGSPEGGPVLSVCEEFVPSSPVRDAVEVAVLGAVTEGLSKRSEIASAAGRRPKDGTVGRALESLVRRGALIRSGNEYALPSEGAGVPETFRSGTPAPVGHV